VFIKNRGKEMTRFIKAAMAILLLLCITFNPFSAHSEVDWQISGAIQLKEIPIDVAQTQGGELTYILTDQAKVLIYSSAGKLVGTVPVDPSVTGIAISPKGDKLYLINSQRKTLKTVAVDFVVDINVAGSPFLGPADAKVVVAVFSDFQ
jgi:DNA-binding beta-propeller fold protein YncE